jgi:hypothetical protein
VKDQVLGEQIAILLEEIAAENLLDANEPQPVNPELETEKENRPVA